MGDRDVSNDQTQKSVGALVPISSTLDLLSKVLEGRPQVPENVRRIRRGKFFLTSLDMERYGSLKRPILDFHCHGVRVEAMEYSPEADGMWCYGIHPQFITIPETMPSSDWPEYVRTATGWKLRGKNEDHDWSDLIKTLTQTKRLT